MKTNKIQAVTIATSSHLPYMAVTKSFHKPAVNKPSLQLNKLNYSIHFAIRVAVFSLNFCDSALHFLTINNN